MDIVVYIKSGENEELRYAIRSWCENLEFDKLCVVGGPKPIWLEPDIYIENPTKYQKMKQALENVKLAMSDDRLSEDVLLLMDDVFITSKLGKWPNDFNFNRGKLSEQIARSVADSGKTAYNLLLEYTLNRLRSVYKIEEPLSFEEHAPFWCNRAEMLEVIKAGGPESEKFLYRSIYGNTKLGMTKYKRDYKSRSNTDNVPNNEAIVSSNDTAFNNGSFGVALKNWFPYKSKYEK